MNTEITTDTQITTELTRCGRDGYIDLPLKTGDVLSFCLTKMDTRDGERTLLGSYILDIKFTDDYPVITLEKSTHIEERPYLVDEILLEYPKTEIKEEN